MEVDCPLCVEGLGVGEGFFITMAGKADSAGKICIHIRDY